MKIQNHNLLLKLQRSGLSDKESLIYMAILELKGAYPSKISEYTGLNRTTVYMILLDMSVKGLVNEIKKNKKQFYQLTNPNRLISVKKMKLSLIEDEISNLNKIIPDIESLYNENSHKPKITYYNGIDGVLDLYKTHIDVDHAYEMLGWSNTTEVMKILPKSFLDKYIRTKKKKNISSRGIFPDTEKDRNYFRDKYSLPEKSANKNIRFIPYEKFPFNAELTIYGDKNISIVNLNKDKLSGVVIEDETVHGLLKMIFELNWAGLNK